VRELLAINPGASAEQVESWWRAGKRVEER